MKKRIVPMRKLIVLLSCTVALISCNNHPFIPSNSIYQEGDVVYNVDSGRSYERYERKYVGLRTDIDFIYREKKNEIIIKNSNPTDVAELADQTFFIKTSSKDSYDYQYIFLMDNNNREDNDTNRCYINDKNIEFTTNDHITMTLYYSTKTNY